MLVKMIGTTIFVILSIFTQKITFCHGEGKLKSKLIVLIRCIELNQKAIEIVVFIDIVYILS